MYGRLQWIVFLLGIAIAAFQVHAAQFDGPNIKLPDVPTNASEDKAIPVTLAQDDSMSAISTSNATPATLNINVSSDVYSENDRQVHYCPKGNYMVVRNRIFLVGSDLNKIEQVKYTLHPSFSNPVAVSKDPTNDFEVWIWSWGGFPIKATITTKTGQTFEREFEFSFKGKFEDAQQKGILQVMDCNE